ncbi:MAG: hypothetical protein KGJ43_05725, partial [Acidobacteriota bacterium]|nr:hypothetical protein [Acidobacteriota bacterium]
MATRAIVTSQPEVACDVCARRLLRGEQPERFVAAGRECLVCELCTARARGAGWVPARESTVSGRGELDERAGQRLALRGLISRLRGPVRERRSPPEREVARPRGIEPAPELRDFENAALGSAAIARQPAGAEAGEPAGPVSPHASNGAPPVPARPPGAQRRPAPVGGLFDGAADAGHEERDGQPHGDPSPATQDHHDYAPVGGADQDGGALRALLEDAVALFNATDAPRRIVGVARTLGAPTVTVSPAAPGAGAGATARNGRAGRVPGAGRVAITAAWELCWYRWEVDLAAAAIEAPLVAQGTELEELEAADLAGNGL